MLEGSGRCAPLQFVGRVYRAESLSVSNILIADIAGQDSSPPPRFICA